jgi:putative SOS response-associated peptidase YedK
MLSIMCGRIRLAPEWSQIKIRLRLDDTAPALKLRPSWNIPPTRDVVSVRSEGGSRLAELARWGLIPHWAKDTKVGSTFNARADGVTRKPTFRGVWRAGRRCLVVADGFYEWRESDRQPYAIGMADGGLMTFGGLWQTWRSPDGEAMQTATIITTDANATMAAFHHRMPVILTEAQWPAWLGEEPAAEGDLLAMLEPSERRLITAWQVDKRVGSVRNDDAGLVAPAEGTGSRPV